MEWSDSLTLDSPQVVMTTACRHWILGGVATFIPASDRRKSPSTSGQTCIPSGVCSSRWGRTKMPKLSKIPRLVNTSLSKIPRPVNTSSKGEDNKKNNERPQIK
uniref:Uncharacterized protein n=1 Tax=Romanomermis culicivorax TaxID=13658 RepID=A0A915JXQ6_ROMCU